MEDSLILNETTTVNEYLINKLIVLGLNVGEYDRALEYAKQNLSETFLNKGRLERKQGDGVLLKDCWNTLAIDYKQEYLDDLYRLIESHTLIWCINYMHSLL